MCDVCKTSSEFIGELVDKISPAFELRNPGGLWPVPAVARSFQLPSPGLTSAELKCSLGRLVIGAYHWYTSAATSTGLYLPKGP
jgi:hypothetical protein